MPPRRSRASLPTFCSDRQLNPVLINVLFIAMEFPPINTAGVFRSLKFAKYLQRFGVNPIVVTLDATDAAAAFGAPLDPSLLDDLPSSIEVLRARCRPADAKYSTRLRRFATIYFRIEDSLADRWTRDLERLLPEAIARHRPEAVYVSMPPFSAGRLAARIAKRHGLPLIIDMRDGWSQWSLGPFASWLHYRLVLARERRIFEQAFRIVTVTPQLARIFSRAHPAISRKKFEVVTNGYDFELNLPDRVQARRRAHETPFVIGYVGNFYYTPEARAAHFMPWWKKRLHRKLQYSPVKEDWLYRSPYFFFRALVNLFQRREDLRNRVRFRVMGTNAPWLDAMAAQFGLSEICEFTGRRSHADVLRFQEDVDALLCTAVKVPGGEDYAIASKTFDYVRAAKPILGFVPVGAQRDFIASSGLGFVVDPDDVNRGAALLEEVCDRGLDLHPNREHLSKYHRERTARDLARIIVDAVQPHVGAGTPVSAGPSVKAL